MSLKQEPLSFDFEALEPHLDAATLKLHHAKHHADILARLNTTLKEINLSVCNVTALMPNIRGMVLPYDARRTVVRMGGPPETPSVEAQKGLRLYGGAHINHTAFWRFLTPPGTGPAGPEGRVAEAIVRDFGSMGDFKAAFTDAALKHFGSGWAFLVYRPDGRLVITTTKNEDNPLMAEFVKPEQQGRFILCLDLWEHSYYLKYRNDRRKYIEAWWNVVNWSFVSRAHAIVTSKGSV
ncbi:superoxide dismutase [Prosthecobacter sp.]|uniref:superoxide dismutase n=1 Tax=Prosthecobacter sp. TaxID=1965333 RepID=UPI002AB8F549|nr:superoxide dismutase [Prosthecobacter sp.]MDZ4405445.1 superoxide dismutase [Prosthecobacter sp.]